MFRKVARDTQSRDRRLANQGFTSDFQGSVEVRKARSAIRAAERTDGIRVSVISVWEIALKSELGKLELPLEIREWFRQAGAYPNLVVESLSPQDAIASTQLPGEFHRDPADRMIVAMTRRYGVRLVTSDRLLLAYPHVSTVW